MINIKNFFTRERIALILVLITSFILRIYNVTFQSFWLDEIHTAKESSMPLKELLEFLKCCDVHPPLFYLLEKLVIQLFGSSEFSLRFPSVLASTLSIWAIYILGKEIESKRLGIIVATLTCFNLFHIQYAQDARPYAFVFLFVCLSFLFLIRFIKSLSLKDGILFAIFTILSLYVHYFGLFVLFAQLTIAFLYWIFEKENKKKFFINFSISTILVLAVFSFQIPNLLNVSQVKSFWIEPTPDSVVIDLFKQFFSNSNLIFPLVVLFLIGGLWFLFIRSSNSDNIQKNDRFGFSAIILLLWILFTLIVPLIRSVLVVPMIIPRYFISVLPAVLLLISFGFLSIKSAVLRALLITLFCFFSLIDIFVVKSFYTKTSKADFRTLATFINQYKHYPIVAPVTSWHQHYYLRKLGFRDSIIGGSFEDFGKKVKEDCFSSTGFWFADAHGGNKPSDDLLTLLSQNYTKVASTELFDAWGMLLLNKNRKNIDYFLLNHNDFKQSQKFVNENDTSLALWNNSPVSTQLFLPKGTYLVHIYSKGDEAEGIFPQLNVSVNAQTIASYFTNKDIGTYSFRFKLLQDQLCNINLFMNNELANVASNEGRNAFIYSILISKD